MKPKQTALLTWLSIQVSNSVSRTNLSWVNAHIAATLLFTQSDQSSQHKTITDVTDVGNLLLRQITGSLCGIWEIPLHHYVFLFVETLDSDISWTESGVLQRGLTLALIMAETHGRNAITELWHPCVKAEHAPRACACYWGPVCPEAPLRNWYHRTCGQNHEVISHECQSVLLGRQLAL